MRLPPAPGGGGGDQVVVGTDSIAGTAVFSNSNNVSFGVNTNGVVTASATIAHTGPVALQGSGTSVVTNGTVQWANSNGLTFGLSGSTFTGSVAAGATATGNVGGVSVDGVGAVSAGSIVLSNSPTVSFGLAGSTVTASAAGGGEAAPNMSVWHNTPIGSIGGVPIYSITRPIFFPLNVGGGMPGAMTWETFAFLASGQTNTSSVPAHTMSLSVGLYKLNNATQLTLINSVLWTTGTNASVDSGYLSSYAGYRHLKIASSMWSAVPAVSAGGQYWMGLMASTAGSSLNIQLVGQVFPIRADSYSGDFGGATSSTNALQFPFLGLYSNATASLPTAVTFGEVVGTNINNALGNNLAYAAFAVQSLSWRT